MKYDHKTAKPNKLLRRRRRRRWSANTRISLLHVVALTWLATCCGAHEQHEQHHVPTAGVEQGQQLAEDRRPAEQKSLANVIKENVRLQLQRPTNQDDINSTSWATNSTGGPGKGKRLTTTFNDSRGEARASYHSAGRTIYNLYVNNTHTETVHGTWTQFNRTTRRSTPAEGSRDEATHEADGQLRQLHSPPSTSLDHLSTMSGPVPSQQPAVIRNRQHGVILKDNSHVVATKTMTARSDNAARAPTSVDILRDIIKPPEDVVNSMENLVNPTKNMSEHQRTPAPSPANTTASHLKGKSTKVSRIAGDDENATTNNLPPNVAVSLATPKSVTSAVVAVPEATFAPAKLGVAAPRPKSSPGLLNNNLINGIATKVQNQPATTPATLYINKGLFHQNADPVTKEKEKLIEDLQRAANYNHEAVTVLIANQTGDIEIMQQQAAETETETEVPVQGNMKFPSTKKRQEQFNNDSKGIHLKMYEELAGEKSKDAYPLAGTDNLMRATSKESFNKSPNGKKSKEVYTLARTASINRERLEESFNNLKKSPNGKKSKEVYTLARTANINRESLEESFENVNKPEIDHSSKEHGSDGQTEKPPEEVVKEEVLSKITESITLAKSQQTIIAEEFATDSISPNETTGSKQSTEAMESTKDSTHAESEHSNLSEEPGKKSSTSPQIVDEHKQSTEAKESTNDSINLANLFEQQRKDSSSAPKTFAERKQSGKNTSIDSAHEILAESQQSTFHSPKTFAELNKDSAHKTFVNTSARGHKYVASLVNILKMLAKKESDLEHKLQNLAKKEKHMEERVEEKRKSETATLSWADKAKDIEKNQGNNARESVAPENIQEFHISHKKMHYEQIASREQGRDLTLNTHNETARESLSQRGITNTEEKQILVKQNSPETGNAEGKESKLDVPNLNGAEGLSQRVSTNMEEKEIVSSWQKRQKNYAVTEEESDLNADIYRENIEVDIAENTSMDPKEARREEERSTGDHNNSLKLQRKFVSETKEERVSEDHNKGKMGELSKEKSPERKEVRTLKNQDIKRDTVKAFSGEKSPESKEEITLKVPDLQNTYSEETLTKREKKTDENNRGEKVELGEFSEEKCPEIEEERTWKVPDLQRANVKVTSEEKHTQNEEKNNGNKKAEKVELGELSEEKSPESKEESLVKDHDLKRTNVKATSEEKPPKREEKTDENNNGEKVKFGELSIEKSTKSKERLVKDLELKRTDVKTFSELKFQESKQDSLLKDLDLKRKIIMDENNNGEKVEFGEMSIEKSTKSKERLVKDLELKRTNVKTFSELKFQESKQDSLLKDLDLKRTKVTTISEEKTDENNKGKKVELGEISKEKSPERPNVKAISEEKPPKREDSLDKYNQAKRENVTASETETKTLIKNFHLNEGTSGIGPLHNTKQKKIMITHKFYRPKRTNASMPMTSPTQTPPEVRHKANNSRPTNETNTKDVRAINKSERRNKGTSMGESFTSAEQKPQGHGEQTQQQLQQPIQGFPKELEGNNNSDDEIVANTKNMSNMNTGTWDRNFTTNMHHNKLLEVNAETTNNKRDDDDDDDDNDEGDADRDDVAKLNIDIKWKLIDRTSTAPTTTTTTSTSETDELATTFTFETTAEPTAMATQTTIANGTAAAVRVLKTVDEAQIPKEKLFKMPATSSPWPDDATRAPPQTPHHLAEVTTNGPNNTSHEENTANNATPAPLLTTSLSYLLASPSATLASIQDFVNTRLTAINAFTIQPPVPSPSLFHNLATSATPTSTLLAGSGLTAGTTASTSPLWPVKHASVMEGNVILGGLMMVHSREDSITCGPIMPQGGIQALEAMLYTLDQVNKQQLLPNITLGAHILDDCDKDTYGLEMAVDFIKGKSTQLYLIH